MQKTLRQIYDIMREAHLRLNPYVHPSPDWIVDYAWVEHKTVLNDREAHFLALMLKPVSKEDELDHQETLARMETRGLFFDSLPEQIRRTLLMAGGAV